MSSIGEAISRLYPQADPFTDYEVRDDGNGEYIASWDQAKLGVAPTDLRLTAERLPLARIQKRAEMSREATRRMRALFPDSEDPAIEAVLLIGTADPRLAQMRGIKAVLQARMAATEAATTEAGVLAVVW